MKEFYKESKQFKRCIKELEKSLFKEWIELIEYMKDNNQEEYHQDNINIMLYQDDGLYQLCIVDKN